MFAFFRLDGDSLKTFKMLAGLSLLYVLPIILADCYFLDDWKRGMAGFAGWEFDGRPLTTWLMKVLSFGTPILDISPLSLILGILVLCYSLVVFARKYLHGNTPLITGCALFFFIANPFFIENMSFKYDSLSMCLALSSIILVFSLPDSLKLWKTFFISTLCIFIALNLYQPTMCVFFCFFFIKFLLDTLNQYNLKNSLPILCIHLLSCAVSLCLYKFITVNYYINNNIFYNNIWEMMVISYTKFHSDLIGINDLNLLYSNIYKFANIIYDYVSDAPVFLVDISFLLIIFINLYVIKSLFKGHLYMKSYIKFLHFIFICLAPFFIFINSFLFMTILSHPVFSGRILVGFGCFLFLLGISLYFLSKNITVLRWLFIPFLMFFFTFSYSYGNVLKNQNTLDLMIVQKLSYDLEQLDLTHNNQNFTYISFLGPARPAKQLEIMNTSFHTIQYLLSPYFPTLQYSVYAYPLMNFMKYHNFLILPVTMDDREYIASHAPVINNMLYNVYIHGDTIIVCFADSPAK